MMPPPELPAMPAADLLPRQIWWVATVVATAIGLALIAFRRSLPLTILAVALIVAPHIVGAPQPASYDTPIPEGLHHQFVVAVTITNLVFWLVLGAVVGGVRRSIEAVKLIVEDAVERHLHGGEACGDLTVEGEREPLGIVIERGGSRVGGAVGHDRRRVDRQFDAVEYEARGRLEDLDIDFDRAGERVGTEVRCQLEPVGGRDGEAGEAWIGHGVEASETARPTMRPPEQPLAGRPER